MIKDCEHETPDVECDGCWKKSAAWDGKYPVRCMVADVATLDYNVGGYKAVTPEASKPYVGVKGTAYRTGPLSVRIELDNGHVLYGSQCWWMPLPQEPFK